MVQDAGSTTAGSIESWNNILKHVDHSKQRLRPDIFVIMQRENIEGRQRQFFEDIALSARARVARATVRL